MLSERITILFDLLSCSNTDISRLAGCTPSNISRLKSGLRTPKSNSRTIARLAESVYEYADREKMLEVLQELTNAKDTGRACIISSLIRWLYDTKEFMIPETVTPQSRWRNEVQRQHFGLQLDSVMKLLDLSNSQLSSQLNIDASLVSRYRSGLFSLHRNPSMARHLSEVIYTRAAKIGQLDSLSKLCHLSEKELSPESLASWFCGTEQSSSSVTEQLIQSIASFTVPEKTMPVHIPSFSVQKKSRYWGTDGLRSAVIHLLADTVKQGGELLLYSDEPMDWMSSNPDYFSLWKYLMTACLDSGVQIHIIHNFNRCLSEMKDAILGWLPLYISGMIEPHVFRQPQSSHFYHTIFLHQGSACIYGFSPVGAGEKRWYDYITDKRRLQALMDEYETMLSDTTTFFRTYPVSQREDLMHFIDCHTAVGFLLLNPPVFCLPRDFFIQILSHTDLEPGQREDLLTYYEKKRKDFFEVLKHETIHMVLYLPDEEDLSKEDVICLDDNFLNMHLSYTKKEYAEHIESLKDLAASEKNFQLSLLPAVPFQNIQIIVMKESVAVLRCQEPYTAFTFMNPLLTKSVLDYIIGIS